MQANAPRPRHDLSDRQLAWLVAGTVAAIVAWFALRGALPADWSTPGSPALYLTGVAGVVLLLVPAAFAIAKRSGTSKSPLRWFNAHVVCASLGSVLIAVHSAGHLGRPPALLLLSLVALAVIGVWARLRVSRSMSRTFAAKMPLVAAPDAAVRSRLAAIIAEKRALLRELAPQAAEGTFSVSLPHLLGSPRLAIAYRRLEREESKLLGTRAAVGAVQAWWRPLHMALAWLFVIGVVIHVITVTFFAGYVADYGPVTWWHIRAW
ncbi:MAG: hypothetical protein AB7O31_00055 [Burkholderiales bacterium]